MIELLHKITAAGIALEIIDGKLKIFGKVEEIAPELLSEIKQHKERITKYLVDTGTLNKNEDAAKAIVPLAAAADYALSFGQQRIWTLSQFESGASTYNMPYDIELEGSYDIVYFNQAIQDVIKRHEILRTVFKTNEIGEVRQVVIPEEEFVFNVTYIDYRNSANKVQEVKDYIATDVFKPFDLEHGPLLRASLLQTEDDRYVFYYNLHHIISDGWSMNLLSQDVLSFYNAYVNETPLQIEPLRIQYKDFANWQLGQINSESSLISKNYWAKELSGDLPELDLPSEIARPAVMSYEGHAYRSYFSEKATKNIKNFSTENGGSLFTALLAVWNILFHKYSGEQDIIIGSPTAGRNHADVFNQIGFYVNTIALRNTVDPEMTFRTLYKQIKERTIESYNHQAYPFDRIVEDLDIKRNVGRNAIFDVLLVLQNAGSQITDNEENFSCKEIEDLGVKASKCDVELSFAEVGNNLCFDITFNTAVYDHASMKRMILHYKKLWKAALNNPDIALTEIYYITEEEEQQLLLDFNRTAAPYPHSLSIPEVFEKRVEESPDAIAIVYEDQILTYGELNALSNQFAQHLQETCQISPNDKVAIQLERNQWFVVALLSILKLGAVYVPIDSELPQDKIDFIKADSGSTCCVNRQEVERFAARSKEIESADFSFIRVENPLAYIMYTSGSTGKPKGVLINQKSILRLVMNTNFLDVTSHTVLGLSNFAFDGSTFDIFMPLLNGSKLVIADKSIFLDLHKFNDLIVSNTISCFFMTTALFNSIVEAELPALGQVKYIMFGGEPASVKHARRFKVAHPTVNLINVYGPTENTVFSTFYPIESIGDHDKTISVGRPVANSTCYILDAQNKLVPIGVAGEICVGGEGLAEGYINSPELTASKFVKHPLVEGAIIYKTGDIGKWMVNGDIECIGRKDDQIKIRGHRIELGEIENALLSAENIDDAVVMVRKNKNGEKEIIAYMVSGIALNVSELRNELRKKLAVYMLPSYFVQVEKFNLTTNGKVDKKSLPDPEAASLSNVESYTAPRNGKEEAITRIWSNILQKSQVSVTDNFFELGGHSLKVARLIEEYRRTFNVKLTLEAIFQNPILEDHILLLEESTYSEFHAIPVVEDSTSYALSAGQKRLWTLNQLDTAGNMYNMSFHLILEGQYDIAVLKQAIYATVKRHEILRTVFKKDEVGEVRQVIIPNDCFYLEIPFIIIKDDEDKERKINSYRKEDILCPFDLEQGPLIRASIFQVDDLKYAFHYSMHHIISDGWSMEVLYKDVLAFYDAFQHNTTVNLQPLKIQYKEYANWQQMQLEDESRQLDKDFWKEVLSGTLPVIDLPTQQSRPLVKTSDGHRFRTYLSAEQTAAIKGLTAEYGGSLFMALLAVFKVLVHKYTSERDIIIGTPIAGRNHIDLLDQIGFYVNTIALRNEVMPEVSFLSFYKKVKEQTLKAYNHQMYPFDQLVNDLTIHHQTSRNAVFDVILSLQNINATDVDTIVSKESKSTIEDLGEAAAKFDLEVNFQEKGQGLLFEVIYNSAIYDPFMVQNLMNHYKQLWDAILKNPNQLISDLVYISKAEELHLIHTLNDYVLDYPQEDHFIKLFQKQAQKAPHALALVYKDTKMTYAELDQLSGYMANYIKNTHAVQLEDMVGIMLEKSSWYVIAVLAILKTGAAYVPIDLNYPEARISYIKSNSNCVLTIDDNFIDTFKKQTVLSEYTNPALRSSNLAYVIYTSGSTGRPKGVMAEHKSLLNLCYWHQKTYDITKDSRCSLYASIGFDASVWELFPTLINGGCLYPIPEEIRLRPEDLVTFFNTYKITQAFIPTVMYKDMVQNSAQLQQSLKIMVGGEALIVTDFHEKIKIYNNYGPTENGVISTHYKVNKEDSGLVPIGKPVENVQVYMLDKNGLLVPQGVVGELHLAGASLARGYLNSPELTQEKFITHPLATTSKLYKTGDLAKWLPDGNIQFMGRIDNQIKLRGYRIELGEIEVALQELEEIKEAVVLVKEIQGEKYITAYIVCEEDIEPAVLKKRLGRTLAEYMVPTYFIYLDAMPVTTNGKVDTRALPNIDNEQFNDIVNYIPATTDLEKKMVAIWQEILKRDKIGIEDSFFALGGHSLKAMNVISKIQKEFNIKIELKELYKEPTISNLVRYIESIEILNNQQLISSVAGEELVF
ncbi:amino acid adenylation domain-containing protein [Flavobacterium sp.]|uniref:amino acid adenylation domain-containing protein n=1 Tax=Flavobacterium sp. TaxID=239 RepID=UPI003264E4BE